MLKVIDKDLEILLSEHCENGVCKLKIVLTITRPFILEYPLNPKA